MRAYGEGRKAGGKDPRRDRNRKSDMVWLQGRGWKGDMRSRKVRFLSEWSPPPPPAAARRRPREIGRPTDRPRRRYRTEDLPYFREWHLGKRTDDDDRSRRGRERTWKCGNLGI